jgi:peptide chain release factor 2
LPTSSAVSTRFEALFDAGVFQATTANLRALAELVSESAGDSLTAELNDLERTIADFELRALLRDPLDAANAFVCLRASSGEVTDAAWVEMLVQLYSGWAARSACKADLIFGLVHEQTGLRSAVLYVRGSQVFGRLRDEVGVHRLIRRSRLEPTGRRVWAYAIVDVLPHLAEDALDLRPDDLHLETFRRGPQHL